MPPEGYKEYNVSPSKWRAYVRGSHGYYEHDNYGEGGGLTFEGKTLVDYDGMAVLPKNVIKALRKGGFRVGREFE